MRLLSPSPHRIMIMKRCLTPTSPRTVWRCSTPACLSRILERRRSTPACLSLVVERRCSKLACLTPLTLPPSLSSLPKRSSGTVTHRLKIWNLMRLPYHDRPPSKPNDVFAIGELNRIRRKLSAHNLTANVVCSYCMSCMYPILCIHLSTVT